MYAIRSYYEIVHGVEKHIVERPDLPFDVPRHGKVEHEHGPVPPGPQRALDQTLADDRQVV